LQRPFSGVAKSLRRWDPAALSRRYPRVRRGIEEHAELVDEDVVAHKRRERPARGRDGELDMPHVVGEPREPGLERRRRQVDAVVQHRPAEARVPVGVRRLGAAQVIHRLTAEEHAQQPVVRGTWTGTPASSDAACSPSASASVHARIRP
jgi:hypothetical protein